MRQRGRSCGAQRRRVRPGRRRRRASRPRRVQRWSSRLSSWGQKAWKWWTGPCRGRRRARRRRRWRPRARLGLGDGRAAAAGRGRAGRRSRAESVQPVPCVWRVATRCAFEPVDARRRAAGGRGSRRLLEMAALEQHGGGAQPPAGGAADAAHLARGRAVGGSPSSTAGLGQVGRDQAGQRQEALAQGGDRLVGAAAGRRSWPPSPGRARSSAAASGASPSATAAITSGVPSMPILTASTREVAEHGVDLRARRRPGGTSWIALHAQRVLGGQRGDHRAAVDAQRREGLEVGLDAGAAAAVGAGDGERDRRSWGSPFGQGACRRPRAAAAWRPRRRRP